MIDKNKDFCFCTLALGAKYRNLTKQLASNLETHSPGAALVILTDEPSDFNSNNNILAYKYRQQGILMCFHDRRLVIEKALTQFRTAIHIDADTKIVDNIPDIDWFPGIIGRTENLLQHIENFSPERLKAIKNIASKLEIPLENANYVGESLYMVGKDEGREKEFVKYWGLIGRYLELQGIHGGDGNAIGLAAAKVGWTVKSDGWLKLKKVAKHLDASYEPTPETKLDNLKRRLGYHYRLNRARLMALKDFNFYYQ